MCALKHLWNAALSMRIAYGNRKKGRLPLYGPWGAVETVLRSVCLPDEQPTSQGLVKAVTTLRASGIRVWALGGTISFSEIGRTQQTSCLQSLDKAMQAFYNRLKTGEKPGFPKFKNRMSSMSFQSARIVGRTLGGAGLPSEQIHLVLHRPIEGRIKMCILKDCGTHWEATLQCDEVPVKKLPLTGQEVGLDVGIKAFATMSNGDVVGSLQPFKSAQDKLKKAQRKASRSVKVLQNAGMTNIGASRAVRKSNRWQRKMDRARKLMTSVANVRKDNHRKIALTLASAYDRIAVEDLNLRGLGRGFLRKQCLDSGWGQFLGILAEKMSTPGKTLIKVDARGTSQDCSSCGVKVPKALDVRTHTCSCGLTIDRDLNAARNVLQRAQACAWSVAVPEGRPVHGRGGKGQPRRASVGATPAVEASTSPAPSAKVEGTGVNTLDSLVEVPLVRNLLRTLPKRERQV